MPSHLFSKRVDVHPPAQCGVVVPCAEIIGIDVKGIVVLLAAELVLIAIPQERVNGGQGYARAWPFGFIIEHQVDAAVSFMFKPVWVIMVLLQNGYCIAVARVLRIFQAYVAQVVGIVEHVLKGNAGGGAPKSCGHGLYVALRVGEEVKPPNPRGGLLVLKAVKVLRFGNVGAVRHFLF